MRVTIVTVSSKGQFTIPKALRDRLGMQPGDKVELWVKRGSLRARLVQPVPKPPAGRETVVEAVAPKKKVLG
jgi:AbrB family looped-hinge helix DNA binding protein